jgi:hypothetical protein
MILMLEDDAERLARFTATLAAIAPDVALRRWRDARTMLEEMEDQLPAARLITLDHDLEPEREDDPDPGTGWDVVKVLAARPPCCPVIVHTSNGERGTWMMGEFELGGWDAHRIYPLGEDWIERDWRRLVRRLLRKRR